MFVNLAELRQRVTINRPIEEVDSEGNITENSRTETKTVWAKVLPVASKSTDGHFEKTDEVIYRIVIRHGADVEMSDILTWDGKTLEQTVPPYRMDGRRKYLVLEAREISPKRNL